MLPIEEEIQFLSDSEEETTSDPSAEPSADDSSTQGTMPPTAPPAPAPTERVPFKPPSPRMGGLVQLDEYKWAAWTGGKPLANWKGLDPAAFNGTTPFPRTPHQRRFGKDITGFETRCGGLSNRFRQGDNLHKFMKRLDETLILRGMDTIAYMPDPADNTRMRHIVKEHTRFTLRHVQQNAAAHCQQFDTYDAENDTAARLSLLESVDLKLRQRIETKTSSNDSFCLTWMTFISILQSDSVTKYDKLAAKIASRTPFMYAGQNITEMAADMKADCEDLFASGFYKQTLTLGILEAFSLANGDSLYNLGLLSLQPLIQAKILEVRYKSDQDQQADLEAAELSFKDICDKADSLYSDAINRGSWPPSSNNKDTKVPPEVFGKLTEVQAMALRQHMGGAFTKGACLICGAPDHWAKDCPQRSSKQNSGQNSNRRSNSQSNSQQRSNRGGRDGRGNQGGRNARNNNHRSNNSSSSTNWKKIAPTGDQPTQKQSDGKTYNWCGICERWTPTHTTDTHNGPVPNRRRNNNNNRNNRQAQAHTLAVDFDPSAWAAVIDMDELVCVECSDQVETENETASPPPANDETSSNSIPDSFWDEFSPTDKEDDDDAVSLSSSSKPPSTNSSPSEDAPLWIAADDCFGDGSDTVDCYLGLDDDSSDDGKPFANDGDKNDNEHHEQTSVASSTRSILLPPTPGNIDALDIDMSTLSLSTAPHGRSPRRTHQANTTNDSSVTSVPTRVDHTPTSTDHRREANFEAAFRHIPTTPHPTASYNRPFVPFSRPFGHPSAMTLEFDYGSLPLECINFPFLGEDIASIDPADVVPPDHHHDDTSSSFDEYTVASGVSSATATTANETAVTTATEVSLPVPSPSAMIISPPPADDNNVDGDDDDVDGNNDDDGNNEDDDDTIDDDDSHGPPPDDDHNPNHDADRDDDSNGAPTSQTTTDTPSDAAVTSNNSGEPTESSHPPSNDDDSSYDLLASDTDEATCSTPAKNLDSSTVSVISSISVTTDSADISTPQDRTPLRAPLARPPTPFNRHLDAWRTAVAAPAEPTTPRTNALGLYSPVEPTAVPSSPPPHTTRPRRTFDTDDPAVRIQCMERAVARLIHVHTAINKEEDLSQLSPLRAQLEQARTSVRFHLETLRHDESVPNSRLGALDPPLSIQYTFAWEMATNPHYTATQMQCENTCIPDPPPSKRIKFEPHANFACVRPTTQPNKQPPSRRPPVSRPRYPRNRHQDPLASQFSLIVSFSALIVASLSWLQPTVFFHHLWYYGCCIPLTLSWIGEFLLTHRLLPRSNHHLRPRRHPWAHPMMSHASSRACSSLAEWFVASFRTWWIHHCPNLCSTPEGESPPNNGAPQRARHPNRSNRHRRRQRRGNQQRTHGPSHQDSISEPQLCALINQLGESEALKMALQAPAKFRSAMENQNSSSFPIIWDSGASIAVSNTKSDFVGSIRKVRPDLQLKGVAQGVPINGLGTVHWSVMDTRGNLRTLKLLALFIPSANCRLLSTTHLLQQYPGETITLQDCGLTLSGIQDDSTRTPVFATINPTNNLPTCYGYGKDGIHRSIRALVTTVTVVHERNLNLTEPQKEWLRWHQRLCHMNFRTIQFLFKSGVLSRSASNRQLHTAMCKLRSPPMCAACQYGKQRQRSTPGQTVTKVLDRDGALKNNDLFPGQSVSVDHFICSTKGRLFTSKGKTKDEKMFCGGCIFVDHASGHIDVVFQAHLNTHETLNAKLTFEQRCKDVGVVPQRYHTDNGSCFTAQDYTRQLETFAQIRSYAGVGAHHQNGVAERAIQTIMSMARTMMLHASIHWPETADPTLWPMAVSHAVFVFNHVPNPSTGVSPHDIFSRTRWPQKRLHDLHVWGAPVYVLEKRIADGKKLPRWKPRSQRGMNMGLSPNHATTAPLVLNLSTGAITPQYHVVFDDWFATVPTPADNNNTEDISRLDSVFGDMTNHLHSPGYDNDDCVDDAVTSAPLAAVNHRSEDNIFTSMERTVPSVPLSVDNPAVSVPRTPPATPTTQPSTTALSRLAPSVSAPLPSPPPVPPPNTPVRDVPPRAATPPRPQPAVSFSEPLVLPSPSSPVPVHSEQRENPAPLSPLRVAPASNPSSPQRESLSSRQPSSQREPPSQRETPSDPPSDAPSARRSNRVRRSPSRLIENMDAAQQSYVANQAEFDDISGFKVAISDPDTLSYEQARQDKDIDHWREAARIEIEELTSKGTWSEVPEEEATSRIIPGTWVFKRKRHPDGTIKKYKARYCVRGDLQEGDFDTYSPVVNWASIRIALVLALARNWAMVCIDFNNAFVQAELKDPVWIHIPRGFSSTKTTKTCLRLHKSLYGLSVAPRLWYQRLRHALLDDGFTQSKFDECVFLKENMMVFLWVDDCGIIAPTMDAINEFVKRLKARGFELSVDSDFAEYLGIHFTRKDGTITMTQPGLIKKIVEATGMTNCNGNFVPASQVCLGSDPDGPPMKEKWNYRSIVGMLLYLSTNTRPDISFAVSQVARFSTNPKQSHAQAIKMIVRYLWRTVDCGTIFRPTTAFKVDCYVDADFMGLHGRESEDEPISAKSRTGYIIHFGGCPLVWKSQLQSEIATSTFHAEYVALSQSMRVVVWLQDILFEINHHLDLGTDSPTIFAEVHEDNNSAYLLANNQRLSSRSRSLNNKYHWFWEAVKGTNATVRISKIETTMQRADYLTKGLCRDVFERIRKLNQGW